MRTFFNGIRVLYVLQKSESLYETYPVSSNMGV